MRVLLVSGSFPPMKCGVGDYTACLAAALAAQPGVQVAVLTSAGAADGGKATPVELFPVIRDWALREFPTVREVVQGWQPDVVHVQYPTQGYGKGMLPWLLPLAVRRRRRPVVQTWHEYFPGFAFLPGNRLPNWVPYALALVPGEVVVVRPGYRAQMPRWWRMLTAHKLIELIPNASAIPRVVLTAEERSAIRARLAPDGRAIVAFFGFLFEHKGVDDLLEVMDFGRQRLILVGEVKEWDPYQVALVERIRREPLASSVTTTGYLSPTEAGRILAAADAVALPVRTGAGSWNTSVHAAILQGTFLLTTSLERHGYDPDLHVYFARPGDLADLRHGLEAHLGDRNLRAELEDLLPTWKLVAARHLAVYRRHVH